MTAREIEARYLISIATLARWRAAGVGPAWRRVGGRIRHDTASVADYFGAPAGKEEAAR
ncbi:MAG TPA: hypothetical protein VG755_20615 [Nannocystaceae bacterium]|nr:hypothetical protein [Nannocystaceae bacterium]